MASASASKSLKDRHYKKGLQNASPYFNPTVTSIEKIYEQHISIILFWSLMDSRHVKITVMLHDPIPGMLKIHHDDAAVQCELDINGVLTVRNIIEDLVKRYEPPFKSLFNFWGTSLAPFAVYINQYKPANLDDTVKNGDRISIHLAAVTGG